VRVAVGSTNPVKVGAVQSAFAMVWPASGVACIACDVPSGVSEQPMSDRETIQGARTRATSARDLTDAEFGAGIESGLTEIEGAWYATGWVAVVDRAGTEGLACTMLRPVPHASLALVQQGMELGHANDRVFGATNSKQETGLIGLLTNNLLTREGVFRDGVIAALGRFLHPELF
jgi:inosine/xanthosine triphosphatase